jgi:hypothetical protein
VFLVSTTRTEIDSTAAVFVALDHLLTFCLARELKKGDVCQYKHGGLSLVLCVVVDRELEVIPCRVGKDRDNRAVLKMLSKQGLNDARQVDFVHSQPDPPATTSLPVETPECGTRRMPKPSSEEGTTPYHRASF